MIEGTASNLLSPLLWRDSFARWAPRSAQRGVGSNLGTSIALLGRSYRVWPQHSSPYEISLTQWYWI